MQIHQYIQMCLQRYVTGSLVGKFQMGGGLGLLLLIATFSVNVPGASAHTLTTCSESDRTYLVAAGDTLSGIGYRYGTSGSALASYNHIVNPNHIPIGQAVCIPIQGAVSYDPVQLQNSRTTRYVVSQPAPASSIMAMINQAFDPYGPEAINVARCESGLNPDASNPAGAAGLFQIMPGTWARTSEAGQSPYNAAANIAAAHQVFVRDGYSWREWTCKP